MLRKFRRNASISNGSADQSDHANIPAQKAKPRRIKISDDADETNVSDPEDFAATYNAASLGDDVSAENDADDGEFDDAADPLEAAEDDCPVETSVLQRVDTAVAAAVKLPGAWRVRNRNILWNGQPGDLILTLMPFECLYIEGCVKVSTLTGGCRVFGATLKPGQQEVSIFAVPPCGPFNIEVRSEVARSHSMR